MKETLKPLTTLRIFSIKGIQMRTFHITWITFFFCFFGWFGVAPLMPLIREQLNLSKSEIGNIIIASVSATIVARLIIGKLCDTLGPRLSYTILLAVGSLPVMLIGLSNSYESFLLFRFFIGIIGASFVITQFHTSMMFAPNVVGTANAVTGGWGNLGGGVTNLVMPLIAAGFVGMGLVSQSNSWRIAMVVPGVILLIMAFIYYKYTKDTPEGNYRELALEKSKKKAAEKGTFIKALKDYRVWALTFAYAACFGIEITVDNVAATFFTDQFGTSMIMAGAMASIFGGMNIFARALGGIVSDKIGKSYGLKGKGILLGGLLMLEGIGIGLFAQSNTLAMAIVTMLLFALFLKMANGCTYGIVPFINKDSIGTISGIVGAGGNIGAMLVGFLFKSENLTYADAFQYIGIGVTIIGAIVLITKFQLKPFSKSASVSLELQNK
ncbi:NarK family nitrate/nitrite MFS transporter [Sphingobacterium alkalisoli]|uniref:Nitrate/nitrite transporter n=1 Tax=Sphingobacterium alkalisoli TaxID=1874115 RepID=A0A4U0GXP0_9SPHI|nr:NarK family nitrate/nitrite MFS transporter [Sphingobacterium alkalisoli]TJY63917.1 NarK family nitrate/nitrite MFS transporter [Sphingobacterium alkalisoli]GGH24065.1 MFS transporter [Sphingobacterium alkalisoli]